MPKWARILLGGCIVLSSSGYGQTTQGLIAGAVVSVQNGRPLPGATIQYTQLETNTSGVRSVSNSGWFALPLLPPGTYRLRVEAEDYQAQELYALELPVAGTLEIVFRLRPLKDVWEQRARHNVFLPGNSVLVLFGPDVEISHTATVEHNPARSGLLESTISQIVDPVLIRELPLAGRDVYTMLAAQPGVTSDSATSRGLGLSVNGQQPSSTNFLLDGLENNNYLLSGPLTPVAPEAVQEYRISTNNFSAEYGRTAGVVANAVTRAGGSQWHGTGYAYLKNDALNSNEFQRNRVGARRNPVREFQPGFFVGGPLKGKVLFGSAAVERLRFRSREENQIIRLPSAGLLRQLRPESIAAAMFRDYPPPAAEAAQPCIPSEGLTGCLADVEMTPPASLNRTLALGRLDQLFSGGASRLMFRTIIARTTRPDFAWSPYPDFVSPLNQSVSGLAFGWIDGTRAGRTSEVRVGWNTNELRFDRAKESMPGLAGPSGMWLPGSPLYYSYRNKTRNFEAVANLMRTADRHIFKMGGGLLDRRIEGYQTVGREGYYGFDSAAGVVADQPVLFNVAVLRQGPPDKVPDYDREYRYRQWFGYFQGTYRAAPRLSLNYGVRYENYGAPVNAGQVKDSLIELRAGDLPAALAVAGGFQTPQAGIQRLYSPDNNNWAARAGFAYRADDDGRFLIRGAYGVFYDRPFDNLWQTLRHNFVESAVKLLGEQTWNYLQPPRAVPGALNEAFRSEIFERSTVFQPDLRTPYVHSYFLGTRHQVRQNLTIELAVPGAFGRKLMATDLVNRGFSRANLELPDLSYRSNLGTSNYTAATAVVRYRGRRRHWQAAYTWSHTIDNQSDALAGEYGDLFFAGSGSASRPLSRAAFARQYDSRADRGNSNFDQRHNLVLFAVVELPSPARGTRGAPLLRGWSVSGLAAVRSGFPLTVLTPYFPVPGAPNVENNRASVVDPAAVYATRTPANGGRRVLNSEAFRGSPRELGNSGRNALQSPGFWNVDFSLNRSFSLRWPGEAMRLSFRADAFNLLNHPNLGTPNPSLGDRSFGVALYGRRGYDTGFPSVAPFRETSRQVQLMLRVEF